MREELQLTERDRLETDEPSDEVVTSAILTVPNIISFVRLATVPLFVWLFVSGQERAAVILYGVAATTDWLDGYIARRTSTVSELGRLLDPLADRIFIMALAIALVARDALPLWLAAGVLARDVLVLTAFPLLERRGIERLRVNFVGKTATAFLLAGLTLLAWTVARLPGWELADEVGLIVTLAGAVLYWTAGAMYARSALARVAAAGAKGGPDIT